MIGELLFYYQVSSGINFINIFIYMEIFLFEIQHNRFWLSYLGPLAFLLSNTYILLINILY